MSIRKLALCTAAVIAAALSPMSKADAAGSATTTLGVSLTITAGCAVTANPVAFATSSLLTTALSASGSVVPNCTNTTPYTVSLDAGTGTGATVAARKMTGPSSATVTYSLYQDAGFGTVWGNTAGSTVGGTGSGSPQSITVYGKVPVQAAPAPGAYADVVGVTVAY